MREIASFDGLLIVHAEDAARDRGRAARRTAGTTPTSSARGPAPRRTGRCRRWSSSPGRPAAGCTSCTCRAPTRCRCSRGRAREGVPITAETCPHYLTFSAEEIPDGATAVQVLPADPRGRQPRAALARAARRRDRHRRLRPLALDGRPEVPRHRRLRGRLGRHLLAPARAAAVWTGARARGLDPRRRRRGGWRPAPPARPGCRQGRDRRGPDADFCVLAPDEDVRRRRTTRLHHKNADHAVRRPHRWPGSSAAPGCAASGSTTDAPPAAGPRGRLLTRGD